MAVRGISGKASDNLNLIRGLAAVAVLVYHIRYRFFFDYHDLATSDPFTDLFYMLTAYGHDAVMVFFVLSGYFISGSVQRDRAANRWSWRRYAVNRLTRLYVVLIPGLLLTVFWDRLGLWLYPDHPIYSGAPQPWINDFFAVGDRLGLGDFLANLAFLQDDTGASVGVQRSSLEPRLRVLVLLAFSAALARTRESDSHLEVARLSARLRGGFRIRRKFDRTLFPHLVARHRGQSDAADCLPSTELLVPVNMCRCRLVWEHCDWHSFRTNQAFIERLTRRGRLRHCHLFHIASLFHSPRPVVGRTRQVRQILRRVGWLLVHPLCLPHAAARLSTGDARFGYALVSRSDPCRWRYAPRCWLCGLCLRPITNYRGEDRSGSHACNELAHRESKRRKTAEAFQKRGWE